MDIKTVLDKLLRETREVFSKLSERNRYMDLEEYINKPFTETENIFFSEDVEAAFKASKVDMKELIWEIGPRVSFLWDLYEKGVINNLILYSTIRDMILFDVDIHAEERPVISLLIRMKHKGILKFTDYPDIRKYIEEDNMDEELAKETPLLTYDGDNVAAVICVSGFKKGIGECLKGFGGNEFLKKRGIDFFSVSISVCLYGGYIYPCESVLEVIDLLPVLNEMTIAYMGLPKKRRGNTYDTYNR